MAKPKKAPRLARYEDLPKRPPPSAEVLCRVMYEVIGDVWDLLEGGILDALPKSSRRYDVVELRERGQSVLDRCEYLCKRVYGDGWEESFERAYPPEIGPGRPPKKTPTKWRSKGRRRNEKIR
jgi:hypothetical protein